MNINAREGEGRPLPFAPTQVRYEVAARIRGNRFLCNFCDRDATKVWFNPKSEADRDTAFVAVAVCWTCNPDVPLCLCDILMSELVNEFGRTLAHLAEKSVRFDVALLRWLGWDGGRLLDDLRTKPVQASGSTDPDLSK
jgi:hypothetical protein